MPEDAVRVARARERAAAAMRRLGHATMSHEADVELLESIAEAADRVTDRIVAQPPRKRDLLEIKRRMFEVDVAEGERFVHFDECFVSGPQNPMGIGIEVHRDGEEAVAEVTLGAAFEGAPGRSHGGIVAAIFDDVCGYLITLLKTPAFTGSLTVNYLAPTPIGAPLEFRARVQGQEGRRLFIEADAHAGGEVVATAQATFITVPLGAFRP